MLNRLSTILLAVLLLASCSDTGNATPSYDEMKKIVIDAIQTEEGKNSLRKLLEDPSIRDLVVLEHDEVQKAISDTLLSKDAEEFWKKQFQDPKFKEELAKSMKDQQTEIMKALIKDSSYQEDLIKFFGQSDMQKELETALKSATLRKQMEEVVMETIENPLLQTKWQELIKKSGEASSETGKESGGGDSGGESGGGDSGGGSGESSGG